MTEATQAQGTTEKAVFEVMIRGSIEDVWHETDKTGEPQECMFDMVMHTDRLEPGGQLRMRTRSGKYTGVVGEIPEFDPPPPLRAHHALHPDGRPALHGPL